MYSASTYDWISRLDLQNNFVRSPEPPEYGVVDDLFAQFKYNPINNNVYIMISHDPQFSSDLSSTNSTANTLVCEIEHPHSLGESFLLSGQGFDMELLPEDASRPEGKLFVSQYRELLMFDCANISQIPSTLNLGFDFIDIEYDRYRDRLFGLNFSSPGANQKIYKINTDNSGYSNCGPNGEPVNIDYYVSDIEMVHENRTLYAFSPYKNSGTPVFDDNNVILYSFASDQSGLSLIEEKHLGQRTMDRFFSFNKLNYDIIFDHPSNEVYIPCGGQSTISEVNGLPDEKMILNKGISWKSYPRLERPSSSINIAIEKETIFSNSFFSNLDISQFDITTHRYLGAYTNPEQTTHANWEAVFATWTSQFIMLDSINTTRGYTIDIESANDKMLMTLTGTIFNPDTFEDTLYTNFQDGNWKGYYLTFTQNPVEAIPDEMEEYISMIQGQYWTCYNETPAGESAIWACACNKGRAQIKYGDMVKIKARSQIDNYHWAIHGMTPSEDDRAETEYYTYQEQESYTPIFIELDPEDIPVEIGAFVDNTCIGATTVTEEDETVLILAYSEGMTGDISFENYYGLKSFSPPLTKYNVRSNSRNKELRTIHTEEEEDYYVVSFKDSQEIQSDTRIENTCWIKSLPNPVKDFCTIKYFLPAETEITISIYDLYGNATYQVKSNNTGNKIESFVYDCSSNEGQRLKPGTYILNLKSDGYIANEKIVIL